MTEGFTVESCELHRERTLSGDVLGVVIGVETDDGSWYSFSRIIAVDGARADEDAYTADASFGPGCFPRWSNGTFARYLRTKCVREGEVYDALVAAEVAAGISRPPAPQVESLF